MVKAHPVTRRQFLKTSAASPLAATILPRGMRAQGNPARESDLQKLLSLLRDPPAEARPRTRWWWFGGAVTPAEISRELRLMKEAGLGGVEIQPVHPLSTDDPESGIHATSFFSAEWPELLGHAASEARRLGLAVDLTLGSGWPFGGPFVPLELAARRLRTFLRETEGPAGISWDLQPELGEGERLAAFVAVPAENTADGTDSEPVPLRPDFGQARLEWFAPRGRWKLFAFVDSPTYMQVKRPTLGMEGYVIDHFRREAVELFLRAVGDRILDKIDGPNASFDGVFCDSLEVYGADWTPDFLDEFRQRRGYDLTPYLPALLESADQKAPLIRYDYHRTLSELTLNHFFSRITAWARKRNLKTRVQAHGAMGDILEAYGLVDVPEGEMIFGGDEYKVNLAHRRLASSAGHLFNQPVVSAETYTWLRMPMFLVTLQMMKAATDAMFLDGINQIVNHGYPYSPPEAGRPGWNFYASTLINHNSTWWRHYPRLSEYIRRCTAILQTGNPVNRIALLMPLADVFSNQGRGGLHLDQEIEKQIGTELPEQLRHSGYDFDLINETSLLERAKVNPGKLMIGSSTYEALVILPCRYLSSSAADKLTEFVEHGGLLVFLGDPPSYTPGFLNHESDTRRLRESIQYLTRIGSANSTEKGAPGGVLRAADRDDCIKGLRNRLTPDFLITRSDGEDSKEAASSKIGFLRRKLGTSDFYFLSNLSAQAWSVRGQFDVGHRQPVKLDPETGSVDDLLAYGFASDEKTNAEITEVRLFFDPFESFFLVFEGSATPVVTDTNCRDITRTRTDRLQLLATDTTALWIRDSRGNRTEIPAPGLPAPVEIRGRWLLSRPAGGNPVELPRLVSWNEIDRFRSYSGELSYEIDFQAPAARQTGWRLDLGEVHDAAEVLLNGEILGRLWKKPYVLPLRDAMRPGTNHLRILVSNAWIHHILASPAPDHSELVESYGIRWGRYGEVPPDEVPPSGLLGPVRLRPFRRVDISISRLRGGL